MITKELIARINALAKKKKTVGLTAQEQQEQAKLRREYLDGIREQVVGMLDNIEIVDAPAPEIKKSGEASYALRRKLH